MIPTTEWDGEFIADLAAERAGLGEPEVLHPLPRRAWVVAPGRHRPDQGRPQALERRKKRPARRIFQASGRMVEDHDEGEI